MPLVCSRPAHACPQERAVGKHTTDKLAGGFKKLHAVSLTERKKKKNPPTPARQPFWNSFGDFNREIFFAIDGKGSSSTLLLENGTESEESISGTTGMG